MSSRIQPDRPARLPDRPPTPTEPAGIPPRIGNVRALSRGLWADAHGYQRLAYLVGAGLIVIGLAHAAMWAVAGGSASGPLSWRKPTTFGMSFGLTTLALGWVGFYLPVRRTIGWIAAGLLCAATTYEVAWVVVQHARGMVSHFNDTTVLDERLFVMGAMMVAIAILVIAAMTLAAFVRTTAPAPMALAIRLGLVALLDADADPTVQSMSTYGAAGSMKFAHAVPMHAIQVLAGLVAVAVRAAATPPAAPSRPGGRRVRRPIRRRVAAHHLRACPG
jgi:hypothetical protein